MLLTASRAQLHLADDEVARLDDAFGSRLEVTNGFVWVTADGDRGDTVLGAGDAYVVGCTPVTVSAIRGAAALRLHGGACADAPRCAADRVARPSRLRRVMARFSLSSVALA